MAHTQENKYAKSPTIINKKARFNYEVLETVEAGIILLGTEVKSAREGKVSLDEAYIRFIGETPCLVGANIAEYEKASHTTHEPLRRRPLLLHKRESRRLLTRVKEKGLTLVPLKFYFNARGYAKLLVGLARGKALHDKRKSIRDRDMKRDMDRQMRKFR